MVPMTSSALAATRPAPYQRALLERLRRAGYADGERRPRCGAHWTNR
jgi:hypothetical protein